MIKHKVKVGDKVEAVVTKNGGRTIVVVGTVIGFESDFGRNDVVIGKVRAERVVVSEKKVKKLEK